MKRASNSHTCTNFFFFTNTCIVTLLLASTNTVFCLISQATLV